MKTLIFLIIFQGFIYSQELLFGITFQGNTVGIGAQGGFLPTLWTKYDKNINGYIVTDENGKIQNSYYSIKGDYLITKELCPILEKYKNDDHFVIDSFYGNLKPYINQDIIKKPILLNNELFLRLYNIKHKYPNAFLNKDIIIVVDTAKPDSALINSCLSFIYSLGFNKFIFYPTKIVGWNNVHNLLDLIDTNNIRNFKVQNIKSVDSLKYSIKNGEILKISP